MMGQAGGKGRAVIEDIGWLVLAGLQGLLEDFFLLPVRQDIMLRFDEGKTLWLLFVLFCHVTCPVLFTSLYFLQDSWLYRIKIVCSK